MELNILRSEITKCDFCDLRKNIKDETPLPSKGSGKIMFVTSAPQFENLSLGQHFSINEQRYFDLILKACKIDSNDIYLTSITKCSYNKDNKKTLTCKDLCATKFLLREIQLVEPKLIVCIGKVPACHFLQIPFSRLKLADVVNRTYDCDGIKVIPVYNMSYLIQNGKKMTQDVIDCIKETNGICER